jgi:hypothetical protein
VHSRVVVVVVVVVVVAVIIIKRSFTKLCFNCSKSQDKNNTKIYSGNTNVLEFQSDSTKTAETVLSGNQIEQTGTCKYLRYNSRLDRNTKLIAFQHMSSTIKRTLDDRGRTQTSFLLPK